MGRKLGDRKDGKLLRDLDGLHFITPIIYPNRCDNEAFISERIDLSNINAFLAKKNAEHPEARYSLFQLLVTAALKTITLRPKLNRFIANRNTYQRKEVSASFVIKKQFSDAAEEGLAFIHSSAADTLDSIHDEIYRQITDRRSESAGGDKSTDSMDMFNRMPRFVGKGIVRFICFLDRHGWVPADLIATDPYYSSVVLTNLGSIQLHSGYHHLTNWGTNSLFIIVGEKKPRPFYDADGNMTMRDSVDIGLTVDERIADGYYCSKSVRLLKKLLDQPELLELPLGEPVEF
ncbi:MAG: 2-oxo acid dehydrogenase subunit E2, partial [Oscillospiraceae bacterium]|nr:2-oxo acid dehydrogenase subunit E2 [Oscillospiraceae bacterium]